MRQLKTQAFEYVLHKLNDWYLIANTGKVENDISVLKALKLLFFISAIDVKKDSLGTLLDDVFNNFVAMPYGHVESEVYSIIKTGEFKNLTIDNYRTTIISSDFCELPPDIKQKIDISIDKLKKENFNLIKYSSFELVELSHVWRSWKYFYAKARANNNNSEPIPTEFIKEEEKIFSLN